ncbi:diguanylate cyclase [Cryptosporangium japonicum]|uniref:GGDEF domain-containing protein n=1 Tax=Cryptosporangium japonicum TaxID=80872 RepID=A0ABN0TGJ8_9ACTN
MTTAWRSRLAGGLVVLLAVAVVAAAGLYLADVQGDARRSILADFDTRAELAAGVSGDTVSASEEKTREWATTNFAGPPDGLDAVLEVQRAGIGWLAVLEADGSVLGASPASVSTLAATLVATQGFRLATTTRRLTYGDVTTEDGVAMLYAFQPFNVGNGIRVLAVPTTVTELSTILRSALDVTGSPTYVLDSAGATIVTTSGTLDAPLAAAARTTGHGVTADGKYYLSLPVAGTTWRMIIAKPRSELLAPVRETTRVAWLIFAGFAAAVTVILVVGAMTLLGSARLAHARLHDTLTGLPNRALFLERAEAAIAQRHAVTALFLDLDGFKPVNDTYGHAVGDKLLAEVGRRLVAATRTNDLVSRFGGDEFLVLCRGDATAVATRVHGEISQPYEIDGHTLRIGVSIGLAALDDHTDDAETLIHHADLALYEAKRTGRGRIERFEPRLATAAE